MDFHNSANAPYQQKTLGQSTCLIKKIGKTFSHIFVADCKPTVAGNDIFVSLGLRK